MKTLRGLTPEARFELQVNRTNSCWLWRGTIDGRGYAAFKVNGRMTLVHRWSYERAKGAIPDGWFIDHLCLVKSCVNPDHLEAVTPRENTRRAPWGPAGANAAKTHCIRGHAFTPENTRINNRGQRGCLTCIRKADREAKRLLRVTNTDHKGGNAGKPLRRYRLREDA